MATDLLSTDEAGVSSRVIVTTDLPGAPAPAAPVEAHPDADPRLQPQSFVVWGPPPAPRYQEVAVIIVIAFLAFAVAAAAIFWANHKTVNNSFNSSSPCGICSGLSQ